MRIFILPLFLALFLPVFAGGAFAADQGQSDEVAKALEHELEVIHEIEGKIEGELETIEHNTLHADHGATEGLPQLNPEWYLSQIFWLAITFVLMHLVFRFKVLPDLSDIIERRREQIENDLSSAEELKEEAERVHAEYEAALSLAQEKSSALFTRVEEKIKEKEQEEYSAFQEKAVKEIADVEKEIANAKVLAMADMNDVAAEIAALAAQKIGAITSDKKHAISIVEDLAKKKAA